MPSPRVPRTARDKSKGFPKRQRPIPKKPYKIVEATVAKSPASIIKAIDALVRRSDLKGTLDRAMPLSRGKSVGKHKKPVRRTKTVTGGHGEEIPRTKSTQKGTARYKKEQAMVGKRLQKKGSTDNGIPLIRPSRGPRGFKGDGPVASRQKKVAIKYGKR